MTSRRQFIFGAICLALNQKSHALINATCQVCKRWFIYSCQGAGYARDLKVTCGRCSFRDKFNDRFRPDGADYSSTSDLVDLLMNMGARAREAWDEGGDLANRLTRVRNLAINALYDPAVIVDGEKVRYSRLKDLRYIIFDDGTELDLLHVFTLALYGSRGYGENVSLSELVLRQAEATGYGELQELKQWLQGSDSGHPFGGNEDLYSNWVGTKMGANGIIQNGQGDLGTQLTEYFESLGHGQIRSHQGQNPVDALGGCS